MVLVKHLLHLIKLDKSYFIGAILTLLAMMLLLSHHDWQSKPTYKKVTDVTYNLNTTLPSFSSIADVKEKKTSFFNFLRPLIDKENQRIKYKQALLERLLEDISKENYHVVANAKKLRKLALEYGLEATKTDIDELKRRIDIVPSALVLAQAANESGWGTSRFAIKANNLFGQWCYKKGCGIVPKNRGANESHEVRKFRTVQASISSYMRNINSHHAYVDLRNTRAGLRRRGQRVTGIKLASGLTSYSQRGQAYVDEIIHMIKQNKLE